MNMIEIQREIEKSIDIIIDNKISDLISKKEREIEFNKIRDHFLISYFD